MFARSLTDARKWGIFIQPIAAKLKAKTFTVCTDYQCVD